MVTALEDEQLATQTNAVQTADEQNLTASKIGFVVRKIDAEYYRSRTKVVLVNSKLTNFENLKKLK